jgi:hypothetical protein
MKPWRGSPQCGLRASSVARLADERGIIVSFLIKVVIGLAIAGFVLIEGGQIVFARITAEDVADRAASDGARAYQDTGDVRSAHRAAMEVAEEDDAKLRKFVVNPADGSVRVVVRKRADTLLVDKIGFLEGLTIAEGKAIGRPPTG